MHLCICMFKHLWTSSKTLHLMRYEIHTKMYRFYAAFALIYIYIYIKQNTHTHTHTHIYIYIYKTKYIHIYTHTYARIYIHTYPDTHMQAQSKTIFNTSIVSNCINNIIQTLDSRYIPNKLWKII